MRQTRWSQRPFRQPEASRREPSSGYRATPRSAVSGCPDALLAASRRRDRSERVRDDGVTSRAMPSLLRRLRVAQAHPGDLPSVADAGRAHIAGRVGQSRHPRVSQPPLTSQSRARSRRDGGFFPPARSPSDTDVGVRAPFGRSACGGRRIARCTTCLGASRTLSGAIGSYA
jgi:hypothetical protein